MIVHYRNLNARVQCDIEIPDNDKNTQGLPSWLVDGATITTPFTPRNGEKLAYPGVEAA